MALNIFNIDNDKKQELIINTDNIYSKYFNTKYRNNNTNKVEINFECIIGNNGSGKTRYLKSKNNTYISFIKEYITFIEDNNSKKILKLYDSLIKTKEYKNIFNPKLYIELKNITYLKENSDLYNKINNDQYLYSYFEKIFLNKKELIKEIEKGFYSDPRYTNQSIFFSYTLNITNIKEYFINKENILINKKQDFINKVKKTYLDNLQLIEDNKQQQKDFEDKLESYIICFYIIQLNKVKEVIEKSKDGGKGNRTYKNYKENFNKLLNDIQNEINSYFKTGFQNNGNTNKKFYINFNNNQEEILKNLNIGIHFKGKNITLHDLSTGELSMLFIIFNLTHIKNYNNQQELNISIDEPDLSLSINNQQCFIKQLLDNVNILLNKNIKKITFHIATHSPFILSDLDINDIKIIENNEEPLILLKDKVKNFNTFGANYIDIIKKCFFFQEDNLLIGKFASEIITETVKIQRKLMYIKSLIIENKHTNINADIKNNIKFINKIITEINIIKQSGIIYTNNTNGKDNDYILGEIDKILKENNSIIDKIGNPFLKNNINYLI